LGATPVAWLKNEQLRWAYFDLFWDPLREEVGLIDAGECMSGDGFWLGLRCWRCDCCG
jgi:hypothetical protein